MNLSSPTHAHRVTWPYISSRTLAAASLVFTSIAADAPVSQAAPAAGARARTLAFTVSAQLGSQSDADIGQTIKSKVWTKGSKARIETSFGERPMVFLITPSWVYKLLPSAKAGVRWKNTKNSNGFDLQSLLRNPAQIRSLLKSKGARFEGANKLGSTPVDVFVVPQAAAKGSGARSRAYSAKGWLRKSDSLPLRLDINNNAFSASISWRDYKRDIAISDSLFAAPAGYKIRDSEGSPTFMGF